MFAALLFLSLVCDSAAAPTARLCSCVTGAGRANVKSLVKASLKRADAVFVGSVASVTDRATPLPSRPSMVMREREVVMVLDRGWKGALSDSVVVWTGIGAGDCGYPFQVGERYVVFAVARDSGGFATGICTLTQPLAGASEYLRALGDASIRSHREADSIRP